MLEDTLSGKVGGQMEEMSSVAGIYFELLSSHAVMNGTVNSIYIYVMNSKTKPQSHIMHTPLSKSIIEEKHVGVFLCSS